MPSTPSDITLAVGDGARRMTYAELAAVWGISATSVEHLVRRKHWPQQVGNDGVVRVIVPLTEARKLRQRASSDVRPDNSGQSPGHDRISEMSAPEDPRTIRTLESAVEALRDQLAIANGRAERAELQVDALYAALAEERRRVIETLTARPPWWRRWFW
jgi:hypothetical protein